MAQQPTSMPAPQVSVPLAVAYGMVAILVMIFFGFANSGGDFGFHVETHQIIGTAVAAGIALIGGWLKLPKSYLAAAGLFGALMLCRFQVTDALMWSVGFLVGWQTGDQDPDRRAAWRQGIMHGMVAVAIIGTVGTMADAFFTFLINLFADKNQGVSVFMGQNWLLGQLNMVSMWTGVTWGLLLGRGIQRREEARGSTVLTLAILMAIALIELALKLFDADGVLPYTWILSLGVLAALPLAIRQGTVGLVLVSTCMALLITYWFRGQIIACTLTMSVAALCLLAPRRRWTLFAAVGIVGLLAVVIFGPLIMKGLYGVKGASWLRRLDLWHISWEGFLAQPIWGWGSYAVGHAAWDVPITRALTGMMKDTTMASPHSLALTILVQAGLIGGIIYNTALIGGIVRAVKRQSPIIWPVIGGLCYLHGAGMVSRGVSFMPGLLLWGGLFGVLLAAACDDEAPDGPLARWWQRSRRSLGLVFAAVLAVFLGVRMWWDDHVYGDPRALVNTGTAATAIGDPFYAAVSGLGIVDGSEPGTLIPWRSQWTFHTDVTTYKTLANVRKMMSMQAQGLRACLNNDPAQAPGWQQRPRLSRDQRQWMEHGLPPTMTGAINWSNDESKFLGELIRHVQISHSPLLAPDAMPSVRKRLVGIGFAKVLAALQGQPVSVRRAVLCFAGWYLPSMEEIPEVLPSDAPSNAHIALAAYARQWAIHSNDPRAPVLNGWFQDQLLRNMQLQYELDHYVADRIPRRLGYFHHAFSSLEYGSATQNPDVVQEGAEALVRHIAWVPFEFRKTFLSNYRIYPQNTEPEVLERALADADPTLARLVRAATGVAVPDVAETRRMIEDPEEWGERIFYAGLAMHGAIAHSQQHPDLLEAAYLRFVEEYGREEFLQKRLDWVLKAPPKRPEAGDSH